MIERAVHRPKPGMHFMCMLLHIFHACDLILSFGKIILINANAIDPDMEDANLAEIAISVQMAFHNTARRPIHSYLE